MQLTDAEQLLSDCGDEDGGLEAVVLLGVAACCIVRLVGAGGRGPSGRFLPAEQADYLVL